MPRAGEALLNAAEIEAAPRDFLERNLIAQTKKAPVQWDMVVYVGQLRRSGDEPDGGLRPSRANISSPAR